jgi:mRNA-degrading endonuclease RelE of RelBE toxin-antitoxin system
MVEVIFEPILKKKINKIRDSFLKTKIKKHISKIIEFPTSGKPMRNVRKGTREVHISPFRLSYKFIQENKFMILDLYHKDEQ